ncbi:uncharacterized protein MONBRDRAFT_34397 [Monosiga brevicollis MX1]|uniref:PX domain-containing protein n=1 Tax=Monosiga brevicollis TaxID=81824 RepID=A9VBF0_MONBE|nr:uncharacterized protein MONBRDRAFT_34397 [Monosiga brevicollis MX1]EDQ85226.1 predicted protein [Monosiga brevicollis MX1]|eukprot:XP_001750051.1 hypothetical protein [Monosiga brevicollis MX1]
MLAEDVKPDSEEQSEPTKTVDLNRDDALQISIADALNEQDIVKFTVHTKTSLERFQKRDFQVTRQHEEFVWLHDRLVEDPDYAGLLIPPCPPKPDFSQSHGKLAKLQAGDSSMTPEEIEKLKQEIQGEYLAAFQKTVAMHEVFLLRLVTHPIFRENARLQAFLEFQDDLACKSKSRTERAGNYLKSLAKNFDSSLANFKEADEFFEDQRSFVTRYINMIKDAKTKCGNKVQRRQQLVAALGRVGVAETHLGHMYPVENRVGEILRQVGDFTGKAQTIEKKLAAKEDLKLLDLLVYYAADAVAARELMMRRVKALQEQDRSAKALVKAQASGKKVLESQDAAKAAEERAVEISKSAKEELNTFKKRRVAAFRKGIVQYTQTQMRQAQEQYRLWKGLLGELKGEPVE